LIESGRESRFGGNVARTSPTDDSAQNLYDGAFMIPSMQSQSAARLWHSPQRSIEAFVPSTGRLLLQARHISESK
jgi:hypothetical protein